MFTDLSAYRKHLSEHLGVDVEILPQKLAPQELIKKKQLDATNPGAKRYERDIPVACPGNAHSITIEGDWKDQGWGNRNGQLYIVAQNPEEENPSFESGRLVASSPIAEHKKTKVCLTFQPKANEKYQLWYLIGGGGGHSLHIENLVAHETVVEDKILNYTLDPELCSTTCAKCNHQSIVTDQRLESNGCNWNCVTVGSSLKPLHSMRFVQILPHGKQVGVGLTVDPCLRNGIRLCDQTCGVYLDTQCFYYGKDSIALNDLILFHPISEDQTMGMAVDYDRNKILLKWPGRAGHLELELPDHLHDVLLFPLFQAWNGCKLHVMMTEDEKEQPEMAVSNAKAAQLSLDKIEPVTTQPVESKPKHGCIMSMQNKVLIQQNKGLVQKLAAAKKKIKEMDDEVSLLKRKLENSEDNTENVHNIAKMEAYKVATELLDERDRLQNQKDMELVQKLTEVAVAIKTIQMPPNAGGVSVSTTGDQATDNIMPNESIVDKVKGGDAAWDLVSDPED